MYKRQEYEYEVAKKEIEELIQLSYAYDDMKTVRKMKEIVPEFRSLNSPYEELDEKEQSRAEPVSYTHLDVYKRQDAGGIQRDLLYGISHLQRNFAFLGFYRLVEDRLFAYVGLRSVVYSAENILVSSSFFRHFGNAVFLSVSYTHLDVYKRQTILVTGASSGIGRAIAIESSKMGASVIITGRNEERLKETHAQMEGNKPDYIVADLSNSDDVQNLSENITSPVSYTHLDVYKRQPCNNGRI